MEIEDRHTTRDKRLPYPLLVSGILAFCLILSVAAHLDAQPRGRNQTGSQQIDSGRLNQILTKIEQRLTALEKQRVSHHQPSAPAMHQPGPSFGHQTSLESRVTTLEQKFSQQPATQATNQASSSPDLTTIEARLTALENQTNSSQPAVASAASGTAEHLTCRSLSVVDAAGQTVVWLGGDLSPAGGVVRVNNGEGTSVVKVRGNTNSGGGSVSVHGPTGSARAYLQVDQTNLSGYFSLSDSEGHKVQAGTAQGSGYVSVTANNQIHSVP